MEPRYNEGKGTGKISSLFNKLTPVFHAAVLLLIINFVIAKVIVRYCEVPMYCLLFQVRTAYRKLMIDVVKLLVDRPDTEALMTEVYNFEETLAKVSPSSIRL